MLTHEIDASAPVEEPAPSAESVGHVKAKALTCVRRPSPCAPSQNLAKPQLCQPTRTQERPEPRYVQCTDICRRCSWVSGHGWNTHVTLVENSCSPLMDLFEGVHLKKEKIAKRRRSQLKGRSLRYSGFSDHQNPRQQLQLSLRLDAFRLPDNVSKGSGPLSRS